MKIEPTDPQTPYEQRGCHHWPSPPTDVWDTTTSAPSVRVLAGA